MINSTAIQKVKVAGVRIDIAFAGSHGKFSFTALNVLVASFFALMAIVSMIVEFLALNIFAESSAYQDFKFLDTNSASEYRKGMSFTGNLFDSFGFHFFLK